MHRRNRRPATAGPIAPPIVPGEIVPGAGWSGVAGSGFGTVPSDPVRTTAKPACRLIVPPNQWFTGELLVGVYAGANDGGSLRESMGLTKVVVHYEGSVHEIAAPSRQTLTDANGIERTYFGWWVRLRHDGRNGNARVFFEAVPRDTTMQSRVIGPYLFSPQSKAHDFSIEVTASAAVVAGQRYTTLRAALDYLKGVNAKNPLVTFTEAGDYELQGPTNSWRNTSGGRITVKATAPVRFLRPASATSDYHRPAFEPFCFRGSNVSIDFRQVIAYYTEDGWTDTCNLNWFDGCNLINSEGSRSLYKKQSRTQPTSALIRNLPWHTEVAFSDVTQGGVRAQLLRGCTYDRGFSDVFNNAGCVIGGVYRDSDNAWYRTPIAAMSVRYNGAGSSATFECTGTSTRTLTAKVDGVAVGTYTVNNSTASHDANANYHVHNVVDWLNGVIPGTTGGFLMQWSATLIDDTRMGTTLYRGGPSEIPGATGWSVPCLGLDATLYTAFDIHADLAQTYNAENTIIADVASLRQPGLQQIFVKDGPNRDMLVLNCRFDNPAGDVVASQAGDTHSHVVVAHCSWSQQGFLLRTDATGTSPSAKYRPDSYSLFTANAIASIRWVGAADAALVIRDNHLFAGATDPAGATGSSIGGSPAAQFVDPAGGDFSPLDALRRNLKSPALRYDALGKERRVSGPAGAIA